jgi:hypothetical protein
MDDAAALFFQSSGANQNFKRGFDFELAHTRGKPVAGCIFCHWISVTSLRLSCNFFLSIALNR